MASTRMWLLTIGVVEEVDLGFPLAFVMFQSMYRDVLSVKFETLQWVFQWCFIFFLDVLGFVSCLSTFGTVVSYVVEKCFIV